MLEKNLVAAGLHKFKNLDTKTVQFFFDNWVSFVALILLIIWVIQRYLQIKKERKNNITNGHHHMRHDKQARCADIYI